MAVKWWKDLDGNVYGGDRAEWNHFEITPEEAEADRQSRLSKIKPIPTLDDLISVLPQSSKDALNAKFK